MNNISIDISGRIDPGRVSVLKSIKEVAEELDIHFFVVGAFARDVIFEHIHHIPAPQRSPKKLFNTLQTFGKWPSLATQPLLHLIRMPAHLLNYNPERILATSS